jgi:hypothetical protein
MNGIMQHFDFSKMSKEQRSMNTEKEKRQQPRHYGTFSVQLRSAKPAKQLLKVHTIADNISQGGLYLQMPYDVDIGSILFLLIGFPNGAKLAAFGQVLRLESKNQSLFGVAICFRHSRLLTSLAA